MELSIVIPTFNEAKNIAPLIETLHSICQAKAYDYEIIVADAKSDDKTQQIAKEKGATVFTQAKPGYGSALKEAFKIAHGKYIITLDADFSHNPHIIKRLFSQRHSGHIIIGSRYIRGGIANMPFLRRALSIALNRFFCFGLSLPLRDVSSGFRLYESCIFNEIDFSEKDFNVLIEILVKAYMNGFSIKEIPFHYQPRKEGKSHVHFFRFGVAFLKTFCKLWKVRNSILSADYDERAFYSRIPLQRLWQRKRYKIICDFAGYPQMLLDAGCGSSKILGAFAQAIGLDINFKKLRYNLPLGNSLVNADVRNMCFKDCCFDAIICSEVIEHVSGADTVFKEIKRVLRKDGILIMGTPDYERLSWRIIEWFYKKIIPGGYADSHVTHYTRNILVDELTALGFKLQKQKYILGSELICKFIKVS